MSERERFKCPQCGLVQWREDACKRCGLPTDAAVPPDPAADPMAADPMAADPTAAPPTAAEPLPGDMYEPPPEAPPEPPPARYRVPRAAWILLLAVAIPLGLVFRNCGGSDDEAEDAAPGMTEATWALEAGEPFVHDPGDETFLTAPIDAFDLAALDRLCPYDEGSFICYSEKIAGQRELHTYQLHAQHMSGRVVSVDVKPQGTDQPPEKIAIGSGARLWRLELSSPEPQYALTSYLRPGGDYGFEPGPGRKDQPAVDFGGARRCRPTRMKVESFQLLPSSRPGLQGRVKALHVDFAASCDASGGRPAMEVIARYCVACKLFSSEIRHPIQRIADAGLPVADLASLDQYCPEDTSGPSICAALQSYVDGTIGRLSVSAAADPSAFRVRLVNDSYYTIAIPPVDVGFFPPPQQPPATGVRYRYDPMEWGPNTSQRVPTLQFENCSGGMVNELEILRWVDAVAGRMSADMIFYAECSNYRRLIGRIQF